MKFLKKRFSDKGAEKLFTAIATLVAGSSFAKVIGLAAIPVITRLYTPEQMGVLNTYIAVVAILSPFGTLRYVAAVPVPRTTGLAANLFMLNLIILFCSTFLLSIIAWWAGHEILAFFSFSALSPFLLFIVGGFFFSGFQEILSLWGTRSKAYSTLAKGAALQALIGSLVKIALGIVGYKSSGLIYGQLAQSASGILPLFRMCYVEIGRFRKSINFSRIAKAAFFYSDMPRYRFPSHILLMGAMQGPLFFTAFVYGMDEAGQLGLALTALALPVSLIGAAAGNAYFAEISALGKGQSEQILQMTRALTKRLCWVSLAPAATLMFAGSWIFSTVFGADWVLAGEYARALSVYLVFQFISTPLGNALTLYRRQDLFFKMNLFRFFMVVVIFLIAREIGVSSLTAVFSYSLCMSLHYFFSNRLIMKVIKDSAAKVRS